MRLSEVWSVTWRSLMILVLVLIFGLATFLVGLGSLPFAWVLAPLAIATLAVALARTAWRGRASRDIATVVVAVLAAGLGLLVWAASPAGHLLLSWQLDDIQLPADARQVDEHRSGNTWCFDYCPSVSRRYGVEGDPELVADRMEDALAREGLRVVRRDPDRISFSNDPEADVRLTVDVLPAYRRPATEQHPDPERIPAVTDMTVTATARQPL